jgi:hypothetical protein
MMWKEWDSVWQLDRLSLNEGNVSSDRPPNYVND